MRLIGVSVLQSAASAVLAPSLKHTSESLALAWRRRLTRIAHAQYLHGNTFYSASQLAGMQVRQNGLECITSGARGTCCPPRTHVRSLVSLFAHPKCERDIGYTVAFPLFSSFCLQNCEDRFRR